MIETKEINFNDLYSKLNDKITCLENIWVEIIKENENLDKKETKTFNENKLAIINLDEEITIKKDLLKEYAWRVEEENLRDEQQIIDYHQNAKFILRKAQQYKSDFRRLPDEMRKHLKEVLKTNTSSFDFIQKVAFHLALRTEVEMCNNYIKTQNNEKL